MIVSIMGMSDIAKADVYSKKPDFNSNDKGLLCVGYSQEACSQGEFQGVEAYGSTDGTFLFTMKYTLEKRTCFAYFTKQYVQDKGWATVGLKSGQGCILN
jgi:hypothetical protein